MTGTQDSGDIKKKRPKFKERFPVIHRCIRDLLSKIALIIGPKIILFLSNTCKWKLSPNFQYLSEIESLRSPIILTFWHEDQLLMLNPYRLLGRRKLGQKISVLTSQHRDGELIGNIIQKLDMNKISGSSSKGGTKALVKLVNTVKVGKDVAITPDGPRGPRRSLKPGVIKLAQLTGAPIICAAYNAESAWRLKSWDRLEIPKPWSVVTYSFSQPIYIPKNLSEDQIEQERSRVEEALNRAALDCESTEELCC